MCLSIGGHGDKFDYILPCHRVQYVCQLIADKGTGRSVLLFNNAITTQHSGYAKVAVVYLYIVVG